MIVKKILIVDDDQDIRVILSIMLWANNYDTVFAGDAISAITVAQEETPDLILLDLSLPNGDGFTVMKKLRSFPTLESVPVIVVTARDPRDEKERVLKAGARAFFQKPINRNTLLTTVYSVLDTPSIETARVV